LSLLVLDASVALAWCFPDESSAEAELARQAARESELIAPSIWPFEVANALLVAERKKRLKHAEAERYLKLLDALEIEIEPPSAATASQCAAVARQNGLSVYAASYLELATRRKARLATLDATLAKAARKAGLLLAPR